MPTSDRMTVTVTQLNEYVKSLLGVDPLLRGLSLRGEISNFKRHSSGHLYFSLKDAQSVIRCVMFRQNAYSLRFAPRDGMQVVLRGYVSVYTRDGQYQFYCEGMQADGVGALYQQFERNKARFAEEGLFDEAHKKPLPLLSKRIGVVTSPTGAVIRDIIRVSHRRNPSVDILLYPCKVQGEGAAGEIAAGIRAMNRARTADVLIVGRGGGSIEDLWAFNEPEVARAIWESEIPVISAVGHETDFTIADFVADLRAPTPSAAAELAVPSYADCAETLAVLDGRLRRSRDAGLRSRRDRLHLLQNSAGFHMAAQRVSDGRFELDALRERLCRGAERTLLAKRQRLERLHGALAALNPDAVLQRGYAMICDEAGHVLSSVADVQLQEQIAVRLSDGRLTATVNNIEKKEP